MKYLKVVFCLLKLLVYVPIFFLIKNQLLIIFLVQVILVSYLVTNIGIKQ